MIAVPAPTSQKAGVRPISFFLDNAGALSDPVFLTIRPEDLTRTEPSRSAVHQTLGRDVAGWVDNFGPGLPTVTIAGHTGWRHSFGSGMDGAQAFDALHQLVRVDYHAAKQEAINSGLDPDLVRLIFVDTLDQFAYPVVPMQFVLRRSKSRPLLFQYNITMQALSDTVDVPVVDAPFQSNVPAALTSFDTSLGFLNTRMPSIGGWLRDAMGFVNGSLLSVASNLSGLISSALGIYNLTRLSVTGTPDLATARVHRLVELSQSVAVATINAIRAINSSPTLPGTLKANLSEVAAAHNEILCILFNALKPRPIYEEYTPLYGASNCSSTTGGRPPSQLAGVNVFEAMTPSDPPVVVSGEAVSAMRILGAMDPVLAPLPLAEVGRLAGNIAEGIAQ